MAKMILSKSEYMMYLKHPAWLWLKKHDKSKLPEVSSDLQARFDMGHEFEQYAEAHFPDGVKIGFNSYDEYLSMPARTTEAINGGAKTLFQARFEHEQTTFICDVVRIVGEREVDLFEIKASTSPKIDHILDLAFQAVVLERCGYKINDIFVMHVDSNYTRNGEVDAKQIVATANVTSEVKAEMHRTVRNIGDAIKTMEQAEMPDPSPARAKLNSYGEWLEVYRNLTSVPDGSVYELCRMNADTARLFEEQGITKLQDVPLELLDKKQQRWQVEALNKGEPIVDKPRLKKFLNSLKYPLYFFDYETLSSVVPYFDGTKPYQQLPFQYSLHVLDTPGGQLRHMEYLQTDNSIPFESLAKTLKDQIGEQGSVIAWNMSFEKACNTAIGNLAPEYEQFFENLNARMADLMLPFSTGAYIDARFGGSASIKNVLPVLVPELSYMDLGIQEGGSAQRSWMDAVLYGTRASEKEQILDDLKEYCKLDTLAMVEIFQFLTRVVAGEGGNASAPEQLSIGL